MPARHAVIDACCTLNLLAMGREVELVRALDLHLLDTTLTRDEPMFVWGLPDDDGDRERHTVTTSALRAAGRLTTRALDTAELIDAFVEAAAQINDADASCIALAGVLEAPLLTDDRKQRRIANQMFPSIELVSTLDALHEASRVLAWSEQELARIAVALRWGGNFAPPRNDPRANWFTALLQHEE